MTLLHIENISIARNEGITFNLGTAKSISISGPSGCGKTLLLRAIADLDPHDGKILLHGTRQQDIAPWLWRQQVALLPAESHWWHDIVAEHFNLPDSSLTNNLKKLDLSPLILENNITHLSSGERQRLALLRLLQTPHEIILLDEPTANIDAQNRDKIEILLQQYQQRTNCAFIWVSHDQQQCTRVASRHFQLTQDNFSELY